MEKIDRVIQIENVDGSVHKIIPLQADITNNGKVVINYCDLSNHMRLSYAELINVNGVYYKNPYPHEWNYYTVRFKEHLKEYSDSIIMELKDKIELYGEKDKTTGKVKPVIVPVEPPQTIKKEKKGEVYNITAIMCANRGESLIVKDKYTYYSPVFFSRAETATNLEIYKKTDIYKKDQEDLIRQINFKFNDKIDLNFVPDNVMYKVSSGNTYYVNFSSCDDEDMYWKIALANEIRVDKTLNIQSGIYEDNLSSALHHELPVELAMNSGVLKYEANSIKGHRIVG